MNATITDKWDSYLDSFPPEKKDIYFTEEYVKLYEDKESVALCIVCEGDGNILLMPYLRRKIEGYDSVADAEYYDFETAYGYGGPIANTEDENWIQAALQEMNRYFKDHNYICGFVRFHPLLRNDKYCGRIMQVIHDRQTIAIDTSQTEEEIWKTQIISKNRNMIRKAEKNGCEYKAENDFASLLEFVKLYNSTMKRLSADEFYFFDDSYYHDFTHALKDHAFLGTVRKDGKLICGALFMYSDDFGHYHLEGSDREYSSLGANNMLLWKTAIELKKHNIKQFHLGGGTVASPDNSLFKFKKAFSSNVKEFFIGKDIFNIPAYNAICKEWQERNADKVKLYGNRLLRYRY